MEYVGNADKLPLFLGSVVSIPSYIFHPILLPLSISIHVLCCLYSVLNFQPWTDAFARLFSVFVAMEILQ